MNGKAYLLDTNTAIEYLDDKLSENANLKIEEHPFQMSIISRIELLAWKGGTKKQILVLENFIAASIVHALDEPVILKSIEVRKNNNCKLPDAIIAATALVNDLTLVTSNIADFKNIPGLQLISPSGLK